MKLKTHKRTAKTLRVTGSGKLLRPTTSAQHLRHNKSRRVLARAKKYVVVSDKDTKQLRSLLPYL